MKKQNILIVDDESSNISILVEILSEKYNLRAAKDGATALEIVNSGKSIDLILLDIVMPEMDGFEVARLIKSNLKTANIPIIFVTAKSDEESIKEAYEQGGVDYIIKPYRAYELLARVKINLELQQHKMNLEALVHERTLELEEANKHLKELDQMKSMFIASMSHELRTPLNSIIGFSDVILSGMTGKLEEKQKDYIGRISGAGKHLLSMIIDVIDISKIEAGHIEIIPEKFELQALLEEATEMVEVGRKKKNLSLKIELDHAIELYSDKRRVEQAVLNFLSNAVKFTEHGTITLSAYEEKERVVISVHDTGIGFDDDEKKKLFKPFERLESHLKVIAGGTGLGLYLTKKIVEELLGGELFVSSKLGVGSTFGLKIPKVLVEKTDDDESKYIKSSLN